MWNMQGGRNAQGIQVTDGLRVHFEKDTDCQLSVTGKDWECSKNSGKSGGGGHPHKSPNGYLKISHNKTFILFLEEL